MKKRRVLFICVHNAARSQMAEAFLNGLGSGIFEAHSAGLEPTGVDPLVVDAMKELGYDLSGYRAKSVFELYKQGMLFEYAVTVCWESIESKCPIFPGITVRLHWGFDDPVALVGSYGERLEGTRRIRDKIKSRIESWIREITEQEKKGQ